MNCNTLRANITKRGSLDFQTQSSYGRIAVKIVLNQSGSKKLQYCNRAIDKVPHLVLPKSKQIDTDCGLINPGKSSGWHVKRDNGEQLFYALNR